MFRGSSNGERVMGDRVSKGFEGVSPMLNDVAVVMVMAFITDVLSVCLIFCKSSPVFQHPKLGGR